MEQPERSRDSAEWLRSGVQLTVNQKPNKLSLCFIDYNISWRGKYKRESYR